MSDFLHLRRKRVWAVLVFFLLSILPQDILAAKAVDASTKDVQVRSLRFDDWTLKCTVKEEDIAGHSSKDNHRCETMQAVSIADGGRTVDILKLAVSRSLDQAGEETFTLVALTPLDVHLPSNFGLSAGGAKLVLARYRNCTRQGCVVSVPLSRNAIKRLKKVREGSAHFRDIAGKSVNITFSLNGFSKAIKSLADDVVPAVDSDETHKAETDVPIVGVTTPNVDGPSHN